MNVKLRCFQSTRKLQSWFSIKDRQALPNRFNVVYKLTCSCGASYIGQTQRNLINRIEEHRTLLSSLVSRHLQSNPDHRVDFHNPEVTGSDNSWRRLQILESLLIQEHKPELNANMPSIPLCIFNLKQSPCLTHDVTRHHHRRVSSWVMSLRMLRATTSLPKQPFSFFIFYSAFLLSDQ